MPVALSQRDAFSYDKFTLTSGQATDSPGNRTFTLTKSIFLPELPETLEVLINGVKLKGDGTATAAGSGDEFYVNSATAPTTMTIETNAVLAAQTDSAVTTLATSDLLVIRRISNRTTKNIDYAPGSVIREVDLDNSNTQIIHIAQEAVDIALQGIILDADNKFNANDGTADRIIKNLEDGAAANDAVNFSQLTATEVTTGALRDDAIDAKDTATDYATRTGAVVRHFSAASGGSSGAGVDQTGVYSAKEHAVGTTTPSAKDYATKLDAAVTGTDYSAKEHAIGDGNSDAVATGGSAKGWAQDTAKVNGATTNDRSAKAWSQGASMTGATLGGSSKDWANTLVTQIDGTNYSAKENATGVTTTLGSAKQWALGGGSFVEATEVTSGLYSARKYASDASASQVAAKNSAAAIANSFDSFDDTYLGTMTDAVAFSADSTTEFLTSNAHGLVDTQQIQVVGSDLPAGLSASTNYFVREKTTNTFKLEASVGGGAINITDNGTGTNTWIYGDFTTPATSSWAKDSSTITVASNVGIRVGQVVSGTGIPAPTDSPARPKPNVLSISGTSIVISENMAAAGTNVAVTFANKGVYGTFDTTKDGPSTDNDGDPLEDGMLYFNSTDNNMMVYKTTGASWIKTSASGGVSLVMHKAVASGTPTSFAASDFTPTLSYEVNNIVVWLNGVKLDSTDFTATTGTTITGLAELANADELVVLAFKTFEVADAVSADSGGTFGGAVTFSAGLVANTVDINAGTIDGCTITGNITGNASGTAATVTTAAQPAITSVGTLTAVTVTGAITANGGIETDTNSKVVQKGAFMQSSTHQSLFLGG